MAIFFKCVCNILEHKASALPVPDIIHTTPDWYRDFGLYTVHVIGVFRQRPRDTTEYSHKGENSVLFHVDSQ